MKLIAGHKTETGQLYRLALGLIIMFLVAMLPEECPAARRRASKANSEPILRVKLGGNHNSFKVTFPDGGWLENKRGRRTRSFRKGDTYSWSKPKRKSRNSEDTFSLYGNKDLLQFNQNKYRGHLQVNVRDKGALVINHVGIENYLRGVVGSEIGSLSPPETLRAQTVIARTYAYASRNKHGSEGADVCNSTHCQVYDGVKAERASIDLAVRATRGIIMISDGEPIATLYHACCGGMTSDNDKVFGGAPRSYLRRVVCPFCREGNRYRWRKTISLVDLIKAMRKEKIFFSKLYDAETEAPAYMDRVSHLLLQTNTGSHKIRGTTFRSLFNLPSTTFVVANHNVSKDMIAAAISQERTIRQTVSAGLQLRIAALVDDASEGPHQLFILTQSGLKRTLRPSNGWQTVSIGHNEVTASAQTIAKSPEKMVKRSSMSEKPLEQLQLFGRGFGHQVGLCQAGAVEMGKRQWSYRQILAFYYSNVALRSLDY